MTPDEYIILFGEDPPANEVEGSQTQPNRQLAESAAPAAEGTSIDDAQPVDWLRVALWASLFTFAALWVMAELQITEEVTRVGTGRTGAMCRNGDRSTATGSGACSWNGGVRHWIYGREQIVEIVPPTFLAEARPGWKFGFWSSAAGLAAVTLLRPRSDQIRRQRPGGGVAQRTVPNSPVQTQRQPIQPSTAADAGQHRRSKVSNPAVSMGQCPRCSSVLVRRRNRNTGQYFLGCSRFPGCRHTQSTRKAT